MEQWILVGLFLLGFSLAIWGFIRKSFPVAIVASVLLIVTGAILYTDGYNSYVQCSSPTECNQITTFTYDANSNLVQTNVQVVKINADASKLSWGVAMGAIGLGMMLAIAALIGKMES